MVVVRLCNRAPIYNQLSYTKLCYYRAKAY